jgi:hypothetical protein
MCLAARRRKEDSMRCRALKAGLLAALALWGCGEASPEEPASAQSELLVAVPVPTVTATSTAGPVVPCPPVCTQPVAVVMSNVVANAMVTDASDLYVLESTGLESRIWKVPLASITESLLWEEWPLRAFGMAQDATHLFVATAGSYDGCKVHRVNKTTGTKAVVASKPCSLDATQPRSLYGAHGSGGRMHVFWASEPLAGVFDVHRPGPLSPWVAERMVPMTNEFGVMSPGSVVADSTHVYFNSTIGTQLYRVDRFSHELEVFGSSNPDQPLAVDATHVYYNFNTGLRRANKLTGAVETFAAVSGAPTFMRLADGVLYWTCAFCGTLLKKPVSGGAVTTIASALSEPGPLAIGPTYVYVGTQTSVRRYPK